MKGSLMLLTAQLCMGLVFVGFGSLASAQLRGRTYYVSLRGDDANPGTKSRPWRTIRYACSRLRAGDTLIIEPGDYGVVNGVKFANSGTREAPIVVKAEKPGEVIFREGTCAFDLTGSHHIVIDGIRFLGSVSYTHLTLPTN